MPLSIQVLEEPIHGQCSTTQTTGRELIRTRIRREVERYNRAEAVIQSALIQPEEAEQTLNGVRESRPIDAEIQFLRACSSFRRNGFLLSVGGVQITDLDIPFDLQPETQVEFLKLVPLVGG